jgi:hypothetical protein
LGRQYKRQNDHKKLEKTSFFMNAMPLGVSPAMKKASSAAETIMAFLRLSRAA